jgi:hypothetical protein
VFPLLISFLPQIINLAEKLIPKAKSGPEKKSLVQEVFRIVFEKLRAIDPSQPAITDDMISGMIEAKLQELKDKGQLTAQPNTGALYLLQGTVTPLKSI